MEKLTPQANESREETGELLPCPYCGGKAIIRSRPYGNAREWAIECENSGCFNFSTVGLGNRSDAVSRWNRRSEAASHNELTPEHIRDWYSGQALAGIGMGMSPLRNEIGEVSAIAYADENLIAKRSFDIAEAMMKERKQRTGE